MPSIGGIDNSRTKDRGLEDVTSLISVDIGGTNSSSTLKSTTIKTALQDKPIKVDSTIMAPNKNGQVDGECKTSCPASKEEIKQDTKPDDHPAGTENGAKGKEQDGCDGTDVKPKEQVNRDPEENGDGDGVPDEDQMDKTAEVKRKEYKEKPRASSVELLGLKKMKHARIPHQGQLDEKICQSFESELRRRKSSPATYHYMKTPRIPEEDATVDSLATKMTQMDMSGEKKNAFGKRMEEEKETNPLTSKGRTDRPGHTQARTKPYPANQPGMAYVQQYPLQQVYPGSMACPPYQAYISPTSKKVMVPGMQSEQQIKLSDGRTMQNLYANQPVVSKKDPEESCWPPSPTDSSYPSSPGSVYSLSPAHTMQQTPSPAHSPAYSPAYSPAQTQPSPQSMMSPGDGYHGMSTSPNSPHSPEMMVMINSPPSVQSEDSGICSPPHNVYNCTSPSGTNSGMVIDNSHRPYVENRIPVENMQYIQNRTQRQQHQQQQPSQEEVAQQSIKHIKDQLMNSSQEFEQKTYVRPDNARYVQQYPVNQNQGMVRQQPVYQGQLVNPVPIQMQVITPPPTPQDQNRNLENLVNNMPLDVLCSLDEEGDTALHISISQGNIPLVHAIVNRLLKSGRKDALNLRDNIGQTPLHICMVTNQPDLIVYLLKAGADLMIPNKEQQTVLHYAAIKGFSLALRAIGYCVCQNMVANIEIDVEDKNGMSPLQCAIQAHGRLARVYDGTQCMYVDKMVDSLDSIRNLLHLGADPSFLDRKSGYTALHFAVELPPSDRVAANTHIIKMMLECPGVDARHLLKIANYAGNTPLHVIAGRDFDEDHVVKVIDHLMSFGADIDLKNLEKQSPRDLAIVKKKERPKVFARLQGDHLQGK